MKTRHWDSVSDSHLLSIELTTDDPESLDQLVRFIPDGDAAPFVEFAYDLRKIERPKLRCTHCHQRHLAGVVVNKAGLRFLVGHVCGSNIYGANFALLKKDYDAAVIRQDILRRVREIQGALSPFLMWLEVITTSAVFDKYDRFRRQFGGSMPWLRDQLKWHTNNANRGLGEIVLPATLFDGFTDPHLAFKTFAAEISKNALLAIGKIEIEKDTSVVIERLQSLLSKVERAVSQLRELEEFFQPALLSAICEWATRKHSKACYEPGLLSITRYEGNQTTTVRMPAGYGLPDSAALIAFRVAISGLSEKRDG